MKNRRRFIRVLMVSAVSVLGVAAGAFAGTSDSSPPLHGQNGDEAATAAKTGESEIWNGHLNGQAPGPLETDFVMGVAPVAGSGEREVWNGLLMGQAPGPLKTDIAVLPPVKSRKNEVWNGYLTGSLSIWQQEL